MECGDWELELVGKPDNTSKVNGLIDVDIDLAPLCVNMGPSFVYQSAVHLDLAA